MIIGVAGLGLIGGSIAKAFKYYTDAEVYGFDKDPSAERLALLVGAIDGSLSEAMLAECDYLFVALYPGAAVEYIESLKGKLKPDAVVIDCCGVKRAVCPACFAAAKEGGFTFIGGHPMAGLHLSGFKNSRANLFGGASMILVPENTENILLLSRVSEMLRSIGFGSITITTAQVHDENIAFTSQLAHVVSNAYVKSPRAEVHKGFSAGSYKDLTRVAWLNEEMWTELFLDNPDTLCEELDGLIGALTDYRNAIADKDADTLRTLLKEGRERKERIDRG